MSWNIHRCFGIDGHYHPERVANGLAGLNADIIALQEVDSSLRVDGEQDQLSYIAEKLGMRAVMGPTLNRDYGAYGNALLSRLPIVDYEEHDLSYRKFEPRGALSAEIQVAGGPLRIVNTHLGLKYWERAFQIDRLLGELVWPSPNDLNLPVVVLGDFNEWFPFTPNMFRLQRAFSLASRRAPTFPSRWPRFALDRIFVSGPVRTLQSEVCRTGLACEASDHLPIAASIEL